jgi:hypothetical protein
MGPGVPGALCAFASTLAVQESSPECPMDHFGHGVFNTVGNLYPDAQQPAVGHVRLVYCWPPRQVCEYIRRGGAGEGCTGAAWGQG